MWTHGQLSDRQGGGDHGRCCRGLGFSFAELWVNWGGRVVLLDLNPESLSSAVEQLEGELMPPVASSLTSRTMTPLSACMR